ncbi:MAG TPA: hypothetical protein VNZ45_00860 [Bacteroidia bacterium]|jgi:hypothetical protein|nr:hypothetical protein [Bacteroidia bacterium]
MRKSLLSAFSSPFNWKAFILLAIVLRGIAWAYFGYLVSINVEPGNRIEHYFVMDDYGYFFTPVDNYFKTGHFSYLPGVTFTGRMPGYMIYFLFRFLFSQQVSILLVIAFQFLLSAVSVYVLSLIAYHIFNNNKKCFFITFALYVLAIFPGFFDFFIIAESLSVSSLIFSLYYLTKYLKVEAKHKYLVLSGLFLTWTIFLREYTGLLIVVIPLWLAYYFYFIRKEKILSIAKTIMLFCLPFILCEALWMARIYSANKQIIFLETPMEIAYGDLYSKSWQELDNLVFTWGENASPFDKTSLGYYYRNPREPVTPYFPKEIFRNVTTYNKDSLIKLHELYKSFFYSDDSIQKRELNKLIVGLCKLYKQDYISNNQTHYWLIKPLHDLKYFTLFSGTGYLPMPSYSNCSASEKLIKIIFCFFYYLILFLGVIGLFLSCFAANGQSRIQFLFLIMGLTVVGSVIFYSEIQEPRYFVHVFALLFPFSGFLIGKLFSKYEIQDTLG